MSLCDNCRANKTCDHNRFGFENCNNFIPNLTYGTWTYYSTTMMECSVCKKHVPKHRYNFCPECGSKMVSRVTLKPDTTGDWEQLAFPLHTGVHSQ